MTCSKIFYHSITAGSMKPHLDPSGSPAPPGWDINTCHYSEVCCVSQYSLYRQAVTDGALEGP